MRRRTRVLVALTGTLAVGVLVACGSDDDDATTGGDTETTVNGETEDTDAGTEDTETDDDAPDDEADGDGSRVELSDTSFGEILVDGEGRTLYLFTVDEPGQSNCEDDCLDAWPPLEGEATAGEGVNADLLGTIERSDGSVQASYGDWPLYYFAGDQAPGDITGQGVNDVWYVIDAEGNAVPVASGDMEDEADEEEDDSGY